MPTLTFDYLVVTRDGKKASSHAEANEDQIMAKVLVARDSRSKSIFSHAVKSKGVEDDRFAVDCLVTGLQWLEYCHVIQKTDIEPASKKLLVEARSVVCSGNCGYWERFVPKTTSSACLNTTGFHHTHTHRYSWHT